MSFAQVPPSSIGSATLGGEEMISVTG